ncbi:NPNT protein, partial [Nothocercus julius]|nr:NPNT protein [Nothocercus julius]
RWPRQIISSTGLCRFGSRIDCCWGWARLSWGQCQPICQPGCKHGECIGPNKCKCHPGYTGKTCNQGKFKKENSFMKLQQYFGTQKEVLILHECVIFITRLCMLPAMLGNELKYQVFSCFTYSDPEIYICMENDIFRGRIQGKHLLSFRSKYYYSFLFADIDECATGRVICPRFRHCINTFGSYICRCHKGFDLMYIGGKYQCHDIDECSLGQHRCGSFSRCYNTHGSYQCKCKEGYRDNGTNCILIPNVMLEPPGPDHMFKGNSTLPKGGSSITNRIPDVGGTGQPLRPPYVPAVVTERPVARPTTHPTAQPTRPTPRPTTRYVPMTTRPVTRPLPPTLRPTLLPQRTPVMTTGDPSHVPIETTSSQGTTVDNRIQVDPQKPRGDVFIPRQPGVSNNLFEILEIERGITAAEFEANDDPGVLVHSCDFDSGLCGWIMDKDDELHWEPVGDPSGKVHVDTSIMWLKNHLILAGALCLSFRHKVPGPHSGALHVFLRKGSAHGPALWGRKGGHGWRQTHLTLQGLGIKSIVFKGEKEKGRTGDIGLDDVVLRRGRCSNEH